MRYDGLSLASKDQTLGLIESCISVEKLPHSFPMYKVITIIMNCITTSYYDHKLCGVQCF